MRNYRTLLFAVLPLTWAAASVTVPPLRAETHTEAARRATTTYGHFPLTFEANRGQAAAPVLYLAKGPGYRLLLKPTGAELTLSPRPATSIPHRNPRLSDARNLPSAKPATLRLKLPNANPAPQVAGIEPLRGRAHYM